MRELIVATKNSGKLREIKELLKDLDLKITSLLEYPHLPPIVEDGKTFRSNAVKKALTIARLTGQLVLGEDSGLQVSILHNEPGVFSSRFSGKNADDKKNNRKLLRLLNGIPLDKRQARYRCLAVLADGEHLVKIVSGTCRGLIAQKPSGTNGFGYDPLFLIPEYNKTFGELDPSIKALISHRARAFKKMKQFLREYLKAGR